MDLIVNVVLALFILGLSFWFKFNRPKKIDDWIGYRTKSSMKSQENWDLAQFYWSTILVQLSLLVVGVQLLTYLLINPVIAIFLTCFLWVLILFVSIYLTEKKLKE